MLRDNESTVIDTSLATVNENPRYPQAYYNKKGMQNPYADAAKWSVNSPVAAETAAATDPA